MHAVDQRGPVGRAEKLSEPCSLRGIGKLKESELNALVSNLISQRQRLTNLGVAAALQSMDLPESAWMLSSAGGV
jgi:hypothetical protein